MVTIYDANVIMVQGLKSDIASVIKTRLSISNPAYFKGVALGTPYWSLPPKYFVYYEEKDGMLLVPKGFLGMLTRYLTKKGIAYEVIRDKIVRPRGAIQVNSSIILRDYQKPIIDAMLASSGGVVHMSTGSGKSIIALEYAARTTGTTTIVVKDKTLLHQMVRDCKNFLGYEPGQVGDGVRIIKDITICTIHSLMNHDETLDRLALETETLIVDEIQEFVSYKRKNCLDHFAPDKFFGMTATPYRSVEDGRTDAIKFLFGDVIATHKEESTAPTIEVMCTDADIPVRANYNDMIVNMIECEPRNKLIVGIAVAEMLTDHHVLILTKRVAHAQAIIDMLPKSDMVYHIEQDTKGKAQLLKELKSGEREYRCIVGTMSLLGTGFDVPSLDRVIIAGDMRSSVLVVQSVGRILRIMDGKSPVVYDMCDNKNPMLKNQFKQRKKIYISNGWMLNYHPDYMSKWL